MSKRNIVINFMDGTKASYYFPQQSDFNTSAIKKMNKVLEQPYIMIEADGVLSYYPTHNIKSIDLYPVPDGLPDNVITGAELVS